MPAETTRIEYQTILAALGFTSQQIDALLAQGVTVEQLRGMWQLRQCEGAPAEMLADLAARIDRVEGLEKLTLDSLAA